MKKMLEEVNRKLPARNTTVQLLTLHTNPERHNAQHHRRTDRQMDKQHYDANSRSYCTKLMTT